MSTRIGIARRRAAIALIASATALGVLTALVASRWAPLQQLDRTCLESLTQHLGAWARFWRAVSAVFAPVPLRILLLAVAGFLAWRRRTSDAVLCAVVAVGTLLLSSTLKVAVARPRPVTEHPLAYAAGYSFPSGHALTSAAVAIAIVAVAPQSYRRPVLIVAAILVAAVGFSRLVLGVHYASDVAGGWCAAVALVSAAWIAGQVAFMRDR